MVDVLLTVSIALILVNISAEMSWLRLRESENLQRNLQESALYQEDVYYQLQDMGY